MARKAKKVRRSPKTTSIISAFAGYLQLANLTKGALNATPFEAVFGEGDLRMKAADKSTSMSGFWNYGGR